MYYSTNQRNLDPSANARRRLTAFFIISIFLITFPVKVSAENFDNAAEEYHQKAYAEQQKGNLEQALTYYSKALTLGLRDPKLYNDIGILYEQLGADNRAVGYYQDAIKLDPNYLPSYTNLGYFYLERGDRAQASGYLRKRMAMAPPGDPWRKKINEELLRIDPEYKKAKVAQASKALKEELIKKAREDFNLQIVRSEKRYQQGQAYMTEKRFKEATLEFTRALSLTPNNPKILRAREQAVYQSHVDDVRNRANSAIEKLEAGDVKSSRKQFEDVLTNFPNE